MQELSAWIDATFTSLIDVMLTLGSVVMAGSMQALSALNRFIYKLECGNDYIRCKSKEP